jgi:hypothetical protein
MPDSPYRPNPYDVEDWANVIVPRGVTSLRAAKAALVIPAEIDGMQTTARPLPVQILDPHRKRIRCEASGCWREAHMTRTQGDDLFAFCPRCAEMWDSDATELPPTASALPSAVPTPDGPRRTIAPAVANDPAPQPQGRNRLRAALGLSGYQDRKRGADRAAMPSRSRTARKLEQRRRRERQRRAAGLPPARAVFGSGVAGPEMSPRGESAVLV